MIICGAPKPIYSRRKCSGRWRRPYVIREIDPPDVIPLMHEDIYSLNQTMNDSHIKFTSTFSFYLTNDDGHCPPFIAIAHLYDRWDDIIFRCAIGTRVQVIQFFISDFPLVELRYAQVLHLSIDGKYRLKHDPIIKCFLYSILNLKYY